MLDFVILLRTILDAAYIQILLTTVLRVSTFFIKKKEESKNSQNIFFSLMRLSFGFSFRLGAGLALISCINHCVN